MLRLKITTTLMILICWFSLSHAQTGWYHQESGTNAQLFNAHFVDAANGWAVGSIGAIIHTTDGGETWTEQSSPNFSTFSSIYFKAQVSGYKSNKFNWLGFGLSLVLQSLFVSS